jgi:hypothetical protein
LSSTKQLYLGAERKMSENVFFNIINQGLANWFTGQI